MVSPDLLTLKMKKGNYINEDFTLINSPWYQYHNDCIYSYEVLNIYFGSVAQ